MLSILPKNRFLIIFPSFWFALSKRRKKMGNTKSDMHQWDFFLAMSRNLIIVHFLNLLVVSTTNDAFVGSGTSRQGRITYSPLFFQFHLTSWGRGKTFLFHNTAIFVYEWQEKLHLKKYLMTIIHISSDALNKCWLRAHMMLSSIVQNVAM